METLIDIEVAFCRTYLELQQGKCLAKEWELERITLQDKWKAKKAAMEETWKMEKGTLENRITTIEAKKMDALCVL